MPTSAPRWTSSPGSSGAHGVPSSRSTRISALGMALPIESGRRSTSSGGRNVERNASVSPYIRNGRVLRQLGAQALQRLLGHAAAGVGDIAQVVRDLRRPVELRQLDPQRRHRGQAGDALLLHGVEHVLRQQVVDQHDARAGVERRGELAESRVERQRQRRQHRVLLVIAEIRRDALGARHHVAMGQHDALGLAGAAGGVEDRQHVGVDHAVRARRRVAGDVGECMQRNAR